VTLAGIERHFKSPVKKWKISEEYMRLRNESYLQLWSSFRTGIVQEGGGSNDNPAPPLRAVVHPPCWWLKRSTEER